MFWSMIGTVAASCTMFSLIPQIIKVIRSKSASDLSVVTLLVMATGVALWVVYGIHLKDAIIITANSVTLVTLIVLLSLYFAYGRRI